MQRGRLLIILAVILGLATLGVVAFIALGTGGAGLMVEEETPTPAVAPQEEVIDTTQVIVALQPIGRGSEFVAGSIGRRDWPASNVPPDVIADEAETIGKVAKTEIVQGQVIVRSMLVEMAGTNEASFLIPPGRVAVAYPISRQNSVAFAIQPGDYVDILVTAYFLDVDEEFQATLPNKIQFFFPTIDQETGEPTGFNLSQQVDQGRFEIATDNLPAIVFPREKQIPRRVAQLTVQAAKVVRVGPWIEPPPPPPPPEAQQGEGTPVPTPTPNLPDVVTLAVNPQDALVMLWLRQSGIYTEMALRAAGEENADHLTEAVTLQYMLTRFNIAVPPKIEFVMASSISQLDELSVVIENTPTPSQPR